MNQSGPELLDPRDVPLGGLRAMTVRRTLPHKRVRTVGAWCFLDDYGPDHVQMVVPPHPHIGLQTVSWLFSGEIVHRDSLGYRQTVRPGELNLMTAGRGITHSEDSVAGAPLHGVQLWVALPEAHRDRAPAFEHHGDLPRANGVQVLVGEFAGLRSPATVYSPLVGAQVSGNVSLPIERDYEYAVLAVDDPLQVNGTSVPRGTLLYLGWGANRLTIRGGRAMVLGGEPLDEQLLMWWNFVGRNHDEIVQAREQYMSAHPRFGPVVDDPRPFIPAPVMPGIRLKPRPNR
jgi:redox-sensitive bicupin YhaK (pirin superfamily)